MFLEKCKYFQPQNVPLDISEKNETKVKQNLEWKTVKQARGCCVHVFLVLWSNGAYVHHVSYMIWMKKTSEILRGPISSKWLENF